MSEIIMPKPNFFIVGAPKCGTTAMYHYLNEHPEIFMSPIKEPYFFGSDLVYCNIEKMSKDKYLSLFDEAESEKILGEASITYLVSEKAANEIKEFCPDAKILIMLRNPVDMMYSMHSQALFTKVEDIKDFEMALSVEEERKSGRKIPSKTTILNFLFYRDFGQYYLQVERYFKVFGKDNVRVVLFDDFKSNVESIYEETVKFLGVNTQFKPITFEIINANKGRRNEWLNSLLKKMTIVSAVRHLVPSYTVRQYIARKISFLTTKNAPRKSMDMVLRKKLNKEFRAEIKRLGFLLDRDLTCWYK